MSRWIDCSARMSSHQFEFSGSPEINLNSIDPLGGRSGLSKVLSRLRFSNAAGVVKIPRKIKVGD